MSKAAPFFYTWQNAQKHSDEPPKPEIVFSKGFHDSLSLISIVRKYGEKRHGADCTRKSVLAFYLYQQYKHGNHRRTDMADKYSSPYSV